MADNSYPIEIKIASKAGWFTPAESNNYYRTRYARDGITVHWWGDGTGADNHDNIVNYMNNQSAAGQKSVNYVLSDNKITLCVSPDNVAWASQGGNPTTISVETQPTLGAEGYKKWGWLVDQLEQRYGKALALHRHSEFFATSCPGTIDLPRIRAEADKWKRGEYDHPAPTPPPAPAPVPPPPPVVVHPYNIEVIAAKQIRANKDTHRYGLNYDNLTAILNNPIGGVVKAGEVFTAVAICHHNIGYSYFLTDLNDPSGYNIVDCDPVELAPPPAPVPVPLPSGPISAPSTETYEIVKTVPGYPTSNTAINNTGSTVEVATGTYYIFNRRGTALNVTKTPGKPGAWINPTDNVIPPPVYTEWPSNAPPAPAPPVNPDTQLSGWRLTYKPFRNKYGDADPQYYMAMRDIIVSDLESKHSDKKMPRYSVTPISGTFERDGVLYGRPKSSADKYWWYGIPMVDPETGTPNVELEADIYNTETSTAEHQVTKTLTTHDYLVLAVARLEHTYSVFTKFLGKIKFKKVKDK